MDSKENSKGTVEVEGLSVPEDDVIKIVIDKYKKELGDAAVDSLLYSINMGTNLCVEENEKNRRSSKR